MSSADTRRDSQVRVYDRAASAVFLKTDEEFGGLSNMAGGFPLLVNGLRIFTSEALYQACRFPHLPAIQRMILAQASPMTAKMKSKPYRSDSRPDWNRVRVKVMRWCLRVKLAQNWTRFSELLLATGDRPIVELSHKDDFWGAKPVDDHTLVGMNVLGRLLMELREEVRSGACSPPMRVEPLQIPDFLLDGQPIQPVLGSGEVEDRGSLRRQERRVMAPEPIAMAVQVPMFDRPLAAPSPLPGISVDKEVTLNRGLKPYPAYKDSGEPWLGKVPEHWKVRSLGSLTSAISLRGRPDLPLLSVVREKGVIARSAMSDDENHNFIPDDLGNYKVVRTGSLVINKMKAWQGSLGIAPTEGIVSPAYYVFDFRIGDQRFGQALLRSKPYVGYFARASDGVRIGQWDLSVAGMKRIPILLPTLPEQSVIARFLDHADRCIQRYIRAKKKLIALLNEQKQAIIQRAVTRGLDPNVRLKPSGVEWLGEVPEYWDVCPVRRVVSFVTSGSRGWAEFYTDSGSIFLQSGNLGRSMALDLSFIQHVQPPKGSEGERTQVQLNDVLVCITGALTGNVALVDFELPAQAFVNQHVALVRPSKSEIHPRYLAFTLYSEVGRIQFKSVEYGGTKQGLSLDDVKSALLPLPPIEEQVRICSAVDDRIEGLRRATESAEIETNLLQEFRTRLIADVVTGKLDVREAAARLPEETEEPEPVVEGEAIEEEVEADDLDDLPEDAVA